MDGVVSLLAEVSHDEAKIPLRKPSMTFLCRDVISFISLSPRVETDDFMARSK